jgi:DNA mismatch repair ATPase MutS
MTRRTLSEARRVLEEDIAPQATDYQMRQYREALTALESVAKEHADDFTQQREEEALSIRESALRDLTEVRDGYDDLKAAAGTGRLTAAEANTQLRQLRQRQDEAETQLAKAEELTEWIEHIEGDPVAFFDDLTTRMPTLKLEVPW